MDIKCGYSLSTDRFQVAACNLLSFLCTTENFRVYKNVDIDPVLEGLKVKFGYS